MFKYTDEQVKQYLITNARAKKINLNLDNPQTMNDKILWLEIYDDNQELRTKCADKILLHQYSEEMLGKDICVPILKIYNNPDEIDFKELPEKFVLKCNHGYAMNIVVDQKKNSMIILRGRLNSEAECKKRIKEWLNTNFGEKNYQKHYAMIQPKCYAEKMLEDDRQRTSLFDYKFWCFNGVPKFMTINNELGHGDMAYFDMDFKKIDMDRIGFAELHNAQKPVNFDLMKEYATKLSSKFRFVRVDFYEIDGVVYLGELTFTPGAGLLKYKNDKTNLYWGNQIKL